MLRAWGRRAGRDDGNERPLLNSDRHEGRRAWPRSGILVLIDGKIAGGDSHFYYTGTYTADRGKWRRRTDHQRAHQISRRAALFGGREVTCGFTVATPVTVRKWRAPRWSARPACRSRQARAAFGAMSHFFDAFS